MSADDEINQTPAPTPADEEALHALSYEQARDELVEVVRRLEEGGASLEESVALWERGERLARVCRERLEGVRSRLEAASSEGSSSDAG